jgi:hypothetical protein
MESGPIRTLLKWARRSKKTRQRHKVALERALVGRRAGGRPLKSDDM